MSDNAKKNALVTGARKGIGRTITERLASKGYNVWACSHTRSDEFEQDMKDISSKYGTNIKPVYFDLTSDAEITSSMKETISEMGTVDLVVNNAGASAGGVLAMQPMSVFRDLFEINFFAAVRIMQLMEKPMIRQKNGVIINIASVSGCEHYGGNMAYGASKAALIFASKELSKELAAFGIRVNSISPGSVETDMAGVRTQDQWQEVINRTAMKRAADPAEIADVVLFLASDDASYITGQNIIVDGGRVHH